VVGFPIAFYMARVASARMRGLLGEILGGEGPYWTITIRTLLMALAVMIIPIFAGLDRIPGSLLEASADLGGRAGITFRRVILPLALPAVIAGAIFTFSLTLGDYITPTLVSNTKFIGNAVYDLVGLAGNQPLAAAYAMVPVTIMLVFLLVARRLGAFEAI
jgi:putative spermidine/putrescine transport system permease protein